MLTICFNFSYSLLSCLCATGCWKQGHRSGSWIQTAKSHLTEPQCQCLSPNYLASSRTLPPSDACRSSFRWDLQNTLHLIMILIMAFFSLLFQGCSCTRLPLASWLELRLVEHNSFSTEASGSGTTDPPSFVEKVIEICDTELINFFAYANLFY